MGLNPLNPRLTAIFSTAVLLASPAFGQNAPEPATTPADPIGLFDVQSGDAPADEANVNVDTFGRIDLAVKDLEIAKVLQLLSIQSQKNIVTSKNVSGTVSADLYGVTFHEALSAILEPNGFAFEEKGNFIYVYTQQEWNERQAANKPLITRILRLNYINGEDAKVIAEAMKSTAGSVAFSTEAEPGFLPSATDAGANSFANADALILRDYEETVAQIEAIIAELDTRPKQVLIEATILQARLTEANAFGVDFAVFSNLSAFNFANPLTAVTSLITGAGNNAAGDAGGAITSNVGNVASGAGGVKLGYVGSDAGVFVRALDTVTDSTILATPKILVLNRQRADLLVGERLGYLSTTITDTSETQSVEFLDIGTQLTVRPFVSHDETIRMELRPSVSDGEVLFQNGFTIPNETTQELVTNVLVDNGQTVVLGGLFKEDSTYNRNQVPGLGDIPILGAAFQGRDDSTSRSEVIFLIKPTIVESTHLTSAAERAQDAIRNRRIGAKDGLLPWSTEKLISSNLISAQQALAAGDTQKALWHTNLALHLQPTSADALALKQQITGEQIMFHDRSQFGTIFDEKISDELSRSEPVETLGLAELAPAAPSDAALAEVDAAVEATEPVELLDATDMADAGATVEAVEAAGSAEAGDAGNPAGAFAPEDVVSVGGDVDLGWMAEPVEPAPTADTTEPAPTAESAITQDGFDGADASTAEVVDTPWGFEWEPTTRGAAGDRVTAEAPAAQSDGPATAEAALSELAGGDPYFSMPTGYDLPDFSGTAATEADAAPPPLLLDAQLSEVPTSPSK